MNLQNETFLYILKQYMKGKKDNISLILLSLREFIIEKYQKYNLNQNDIKMLIKFIVRGINTYSFEKSISFQDYINIYTDIALSEYKKADQIEEFNILDDKFLDVFINNVKDMIEKNKVKRLNLD